MAMPTDIGIIDTMIGFPMRDKQAVYEFIKKQTKDADSKQSDFPAEYMFKESPKQYEGDEDPVDVTLREMDKFGVERGLIGVHNDEGKRALKQHPDRFIPSMSADPNDGVEGLRTIVRNYEEFGIRSVGVFPCGTFPQVAINDKLMYPIYAKCCELDIAAFVNAGVPGPRLKYDPQKVEYLDEVMFDFPELTLVTRHGCEPWTELAVKLMLKWPGLYYSTSAFAPEVLPARHHQLRQHARRRQDHLRGLLPDGPHAGAHHDRDAERALQGRRVAEVPPRQRGAGAQDRVTTLEWHDDEPAHAGAARRILGPGAPFEIVEKTCRARASRCSRNARPTCAPCSTTRPRSSATGRSSCSRGDDHLRRDDHARCQFAVAAGGARRRLRARAR